MESILQVKNITKEYKVADMTQMALNDVSLAFRDSEFVAILGPSGSGKTTLLNILGGLDRYTSGDLIIDNISTKKYKDRDWDSYRNHSVGFIFQSYNLIPHQTLLSNVELSLTISGISRFERRNLAKAALEKVGLKDHITKKPNMISGGQAQRVSIARALVNNPTIVLADEPTGALDSKTSVEIMEMLKEVAKDRLVVMVTHNPDLAHKYADRIIELKDGVITSDSNPYEPKEDIKVEHKNMGHSSMSFLSSILLSLNNLKTKAARTFLTSFAGSIGIIGIAMILSLSNGVNAYIKNIQEETLSEYPLTIMQTEMDITALLEQGQSLTVGQGDAPDSDTVYESKILSSMLGGTTTNDLKSFREYIEKDYSHIKTYTTSVEYAYSITPYIYRYEKNDYRQLNPDPSFSKFGSSSIMSIMSAVRSNIQSFSSLPENKQMYESQYDVLEGRWPEKYTECVVVLTSDNRITDMNLYILNLKDNAELDEALEKYAKNENVETESDPITLNYSDFIGIKFKLVNVSDCYEFDEEYGVYVDKSENKQFMLNVLKNSEDMEIVGVVRPNPDATATMLMPGICYPKELEYYVMHQAQESEIVRKQMENPEINVFTGEEFGKDQDFDMSKLFSIDEEAFENLFKAEDGGFNFEGINLDGLDFSDFSQMDFSSIKIPTNFDLSSVIKNLSVDISYDEMMKLIEELLKGYSEYSAQDASTDYSKLGESIQAFFESEKAWAVFDNYTEDIRERVSEILPTQSELTAIIEDVMSGFPEFMETYEGDIQEALAAYIYSDYAQEKISSYVEGFAKELAETDMSDISQAIATDLYNAYEEFAEENGMPQLSKLPDSFKEYMETEEAKKILSDGIGKVINADELSNQLSGVMQSVMNEISNQISKQIVSIMSQMSNQIAAAITEQIQLGMQGMMDSMKESLSEGAEQFADIVSVNMDSDSLYELMVSMMSPESSYDSNLSTLNYATEDNPSYISIYPKDFDNKTKIIESIEAYNDSMKTLGEDDKVLTYSDTVASLMSSVSTIVNTISYVLVAFVSVSLIVSSIMIGIITYISVLERTKEIGILRAIGASKRNITQVFNAETGIIGLLSGIMGITTTLLLLIPLNLILSNVLDIHVKAMIAPESAIILIALSIVLTLIGGLIPSKAAAKKDPVTALRTE